MHGSFILVALALLQQNDPKAGAPRLNVRAERGMGGLQSDGWQHIALRLDNSSGQPITGTATLYEWESGGGARPRITLPFTVTDRQVVHFYPFRPPETPQPSSYVITIEDESGRQIPFDGGSQFVIHGQSTRAIRVDMGSAPTAEFRIAISGDSSPFLKSLFNEWNPPYDELVRSHGSSAAQWQRFSRGNTRISSEATTVDNPRLFPDSYIGYGDLQVLFAVRLDFDMLLTERQRRALDDWIHSGGVLVFLPKDQQQLTGPFSRNLLGTRNRGELTTENDQHLKLGPHAGPPHQIVHFLATFEPPRPMEILASYETHPVIYSVPAGYGRVWIAAFDPESHGGLPRYKPIWTEILNRIFKRAVTEGPSPTGMATQAWSLDNDRKWLATLSERFGKFPSAEHLAALILFYLLIIGPANFFVLKRREARVWLIGTVPALAAVFGSIVLSMGYLSHGLRSATNYLALSVVTPEGDRSFCEEYVAVYGTTSTEYQLDFPRNLPVRPLAEYFANPNGGFENPSSFHLHAREDRQTLRNWRLTFWQTRAAAVVNCTPLSGLLTARRSMNEIAVRNGTEIQFDNLMLLSGTDYPIGPIKPFQTITLEVINDAVDSDSSDESPSNITELYLKARLTQPGTRVVRRVDDGSATQSGGMSSDGTGTEWPNDESHALLEAAGNRLKARAGDWIVGLTRQPIHPIRSPDTARRLNATVYAWPIVPAD